MNIVLFAPLLAVFFASDVFAEPGLYARPAFRGELNQTLYVMMERQGNRAILEVETPGWPTGEVYEIVRENALWNTYKKGEAPQPAYGETIYPNPPRERCIGLTEIGVGLTPLLGGWHITVHKDHRGEPGSFRSAIEPLWVSETQYGRIKAWNQKRYYADNCSRMLVAFQVVFENETTMSYLYEIGEVGKTER